MATRPSTSLQAVGLLLAAVAVALALVARSEPLPVGLGWLALAPAAALVVARPARAAAIGGAVAYVAILDWAYTSHFSPVYAYTGLIDAGPSPGAKLAVAALSAAPAAWIPISARRPSTIVLWTLYAVGYVPTAMVPVYLTGDLDRVLAFQIGLISSMVILGLMVRVRPPPLRVPHLTLASFTRLLTVLSVLSILYIAAVFGLHPPPSLADVYTTRAEFGAAQGGAAFSGYIVPWAANAINPMLMALGIARRRADLVALGLLGQLIIYADTGYKAVLFSILLVPLVYAAIAAACRWFGTLTIIGTPIILAGAVLASSRPGDWPIALATRVFATPGHVGWYFYDYFSSHAQYHLSHSFLSWITSSPYTIDAPLLIGAVYFHQGTDANTSFWADAFANFGFTGIVVFTVVCGIVLLGLDAIGWGRDARIAGPMLAIAGLSLGSTGLFTTLLTQGVVLGAVLLALMPPRSDA
jgi:O-antigen polymerase